MVGVVIPYSGEQHAPPGVGARAGLTDPGQARFHQIRTALDEVTGRLFAELPAEDLANAGRVLAIVTARATAEVESA